MGYKITISPKAFSDIDEALEYYAETPATITKFNNELNEAWKLISLNPHFRIRYKDIHGFPIRKFPFLIFYKVNETNKTVLVYSVFNTYLNPAKYPKE